MEQVEVNYKNSFLIWWSFFWRATLFGSIAGAILGAIGGFLLGLFGNEELAPFAGMILGFLVSIPIGIWVFKVVLNKKFKDFKIVLVKNED